MTPTKLKTKQKLIKIYKNNKKLPFNNKNKFKNRNKTIIKT